MKTALIIGMARSGIASARLLYDKGWRVIINDMKAHIDGLSDALCGIEYVDGMGRDPMELLDGVDLMVLSPVVPIFAPFAVEAKRRGIDVIGEIELGYRYCDRGANFVCISGTNGKTTTTALTGELFKAAGLPTHVLGNIGIPITSQAEDVKAGDYIVAETAALQLESIDTFRARAAGMLNITEDHLNRFQYDIRNYIAAKCRVFENQTEDDFACLNYDDPIVRDMARFTKARVIFFSQVEEPENGAFIRNGRMIWRMDGVETDVIATSELRIPGAHNVENALCAMALAMCMGVPADAVRDGMRSFPGVEHRIEFVREVDGVRYFNDSKGTNPDSTIKAILAMNRPTVLLLGVGNYDKHSDFKPVFDTFGDTVKAVVASGCNIPAIMDAAEKTGFTNITTATDDLSQMLDAARGMCEPGWNILLSPAAASWGVFRDYEHRGDVFKELVNKL